MEVPADAEPRACGEQVSEVSELGVGVGVGVGVGPGRSEVYSSITWLGLGLGTPRAPS